jgi:HEXXH motif-containing protein
MDVDWSRAAVPQDDLYDARLAAHLASTSASPLRDVYWTRRPVGDAPALFDGAVAARYCYPATYYPTLTDAPLDHPHLTLAADLVRRWPAAYEQFRMLIDSVHPLLIPNEAQDDPDHLGYARSHGEEHMFGTIMASVNSAVMLAECLVHEMAHHKLRAFGVSFETAWRFIANPLEALFESPIRKDKLRPMTAVFHAMYSYTYVTELDLRIIDGEPDGRRMDKLLRRLAYNVKRLEEGRAVLRQHMTVDAEGELFMTPYHDWLDVVIARGRARGAAPQRP